MDRSAIIHYLFHSGFSVETSRCFFVFDYWGSHLKGRFGEAVRPVLQAGLTDRQRSVIVLASHQHRDHYDPDILGWSRQNPDIRYVFSRDIAAGSGGQVSYLSAYEQLQLGDVTIRAFDSTDAGVSFLVQADGLSIFHAGDLNWWHWPDESTAEELAQAEQAYKMAVGKLTGETIDIAFFPVDPRLKAHSQLGGVYFAEALRPNLLIPMHFGLEYGVTGAFAAKINHLPVQVAEIRAIGQTIQYSQPAQRSGQE
jgi:L-ascorbate metabolism protein UlaG (beta-lactamase superfamily)